MQPGRYNYFDKTTLKGGEVYVPNSPPVNVFSEYKWPTQYAVF